MSGIWDWLTGREGRKWLYSLAVAMVPLLVLYGAISQEYAPLWLGVIAAFLGVASPIMALSHLTPREAGPEDSIAIPEDAQYVDLDVEK